MESTLRRTWAEIDLDALAHNYRTLRAHVGPAVKFLGVVKADEMCIRDSLLTDIWNITSVNYDRYFKYCQEGL